MGTIAASAALPKKNLLHQQRRLNLCDEIAEVTKRRVLPSWNYWRAARFISRQAGRAPIAGRAPWAWRRRMPAFGQSEPLLPCRLRNPSLDRIVVLACRAHRSWGQTQKSTGNARRNRYAAPSIVTMRPIARSRRGRGRFDPGLRMRKAFASTTCRLLRLVLPQLAPRRFPSGGRSAMTLAVEKAHAGPGV
jgi:hypothetical protein